jgi:hypothetical protein
MSVAHISSKSCICLSGFSSKPPAKFNSLTKDMKSERISYPSASIGCSEVASSRYFPSGAEKTIDMGANHIYSTITNFFLIIFRYKRWIKIKNTNLAQLSTTTALGSLLAVLKPNRIICKCTDANCSSFHQRVFPGLSNLQG